MAQVYSDADAPLTPLLHRTVAIIGYGSQGHAQAQNLRDSGIKVIVGARMGLSWERAQADGFEVCTIPEAVARADVLMLLVNDEAQPALYREQIAPHLRPGQTLGFAHGFNIHYGQITPPEDVDVILVSPKAVGPQLRRLYLQGHGAPCLIAVHQDYTGEAKAIALAYARALGGTRAGVYETTFREECEADLFGEQAVLCGGVPALIRAAFETLVEAGYAPEVAYFECLHELKLITDLIYESGIRGMLFAISDTAQYGATTRGERIIDAHVRENLRAVLRDIQTGQFAREWILENLAGRPVFRALERAAAEHPIEQVGEVVRARMAFHKSSTQTP
ncbi:MAG: ketol-acid reductoisomerase [Fimbriimonadales bacterium]|nr:ketol-acid reductoisomerase [Fimbriimonadales bacterium]MDW8052332.1 ketol-acid reductoisomerase [Armatimonadota bacterium]